MWLAELRSNREQLTFTAEMLPVAARVIYMLRAIFIFAQFVPGSAGLGLGLTRI